MLTLKEELNLFYKKYNLPEDGGVDDKTFGVPLPFFELKLPNYAWRKRMLHVHDLEHILNKQDTTWRGEIFIASWEIATGFWKYFPICIFPLWTVGFGLFKHPSSVYNGFLKGSHDTGIAQIKMQREELLKLNITDLHILTEDKKHFARLKFLLKLVLGSFTGLIVFLLPFLLLLLGALFMTKML